MDKYKKQIIKSIKKGYYDKNGMPLKCPYCANKTFQEVPKDYVDNILCEYEVVCPKCSNDIGYWAYGSFDSDYMCIKGSMFKIFKNNIKLYFKERKENK